jgi:hypothetical protein
VKKYWCAQAGVMPHVAHAWMRACVHLMLAPLLTCTRTRTRDPPFVLCRKCERGLHPPLGELQAVVRAALRARAAAAAPPPSDAAVAAAAAAATRAFAGLLASLCALPGRVPPAQRAGTDTLLLLLHAQAGDAAAAEALACAPGRVFDVPHATAALSAMGRHMAAAALHAHAGDAAAAVAVYRDLASGQLAEAHAADGAVAAAGGGVIAAAAAAASAAAALLSRCDDAELVLSALTWLLDAAPDAALRALTARPPRGAGAAALPRERVLALLRPRGGEPLLSYLEHLAFGGGEEATAPDADLAGDRALCTELGLALFDAVARARAATSAASSSSASVVASAGASASSASLAAGDERSAPRTRLRAFLARARRRYDAPPLLAAADAADAAAAATAQHAPLLRERVLLHAAAGNHTAALALLVNRLGDLDAAEAYVARGDSASSRADARIALLDLYLRPSAAAAGGGGSPRYARAAALLSSAPGGECVDGERALGAVPDGTPLAAALPLLAGLLHAGSHARRSGALGAALARRRHQVAAEALAEERARGLVLGADATCGACHARLARPGEPLRPFARFPTGLLACHACAAGLAPTLQHGAAVPAPAGAWDGA